MRKWSKQGFLNPADSNDDGWYKFSIRPKVNKKMLGTSIQYIISDCSNKIYLEFGPEYLALDDKTGKPQRLADAREVLAEIKVKRKKVKDFAAAVALSGERMLEALDDLEDLINETLTRVDSDE